MRMINGNGQMSNGTAVHTVIGRSFDGRIKLYSRPYGVMNLVPGYIVRVGDNYYRVYEDGRKGMRYWNVDAEVRAEMALASVRSIEYVEVAS